MFFRVLIMISQHYITIAYESRWAAQNSHKSSGESQRVLLYNIDCMHLLYHIDCKHLLYHIDCKHLLYHIDLVSLYFFP